jgi:CHAD domain-containing protein
MPADGKWVEGLTADMKWAEAGGRILAARLDAVENNWRWALHESIDPEAVHQLRVSTRRARAAVQMFADLLPQRGVKELNRLLKKLRNVAGPARDWDVFLIHLMAWSANRPDQEQPGLDLLAGSALTMRQSCQKHVKESERWQECWTNLRPKLRPRRGYRQRLGPQARRLVNLMVSEFRTAVEVVNPTGEQLHQVRIAGKRLRYGLELFVDVLDSCVRESWLPLMEELQETLGSANDARNLLMHLDESKQALRRLGPDQNQRYLTGIDAWRDHLTSHIVANVTEFQSWRDRWHLAVGPSLGETPMAS